MNINRGEYSITDDTESVDINAVKQLLSKTYWAAERPLDTIKKSVEHSVCFSLFHLERQIGFARIVTDFATEPIVPHAGNPGRPRSLREIWI